VLQPVDVSWMRAFKTEFVNRLTVWGSAELQQYLRKRLHPSRGLSAVMTRRWEIVSAACEAAAASTQTFHSRVLTADDCASALRQRAEEKRRWRRKRTAPPEEDPIAAEDAPHFEADDGLEFEGFALAAELTLPPDVEDTVTE
jgi:hypothetical protein